MKTPVAIGLLLCEQVIMEHETRNLTPVNCFSRRYYDSFPTADAFVVFAILIDGTGEMSLEVVVERLDTMDEVYRREVPVHFDSPLNELRCILRIRDCSFPQPGQYQVSLLVGGEWLAHRKIVLFERGEA